MGNKKIYVFLLLVSLLLVCLYLLVGLDFQIARYMLSRRITRLLGILLVAVTVGVSTVIFQTLTNNRILTPSMLGLDSMYMLIQTVIVFFLGSSSVFIRSSELNYFISILLMVSISVFVYYFLFQKLGNNLMGLLLFGMILSTLFRSFTSFLQMIIDPNEFSLIQDSSFASFNNMSTDVLWISLVVVAVCIAFLSEEFLKVDIVSLGKDHAINLGIPYNSIQKKYLIYISILIAVSTALVGPILFLGLLVVNIARQITKTYKHKDLAILSVLIGVIFLVFGQLLLERVFQFAIPLSIFINFIGGLYMLILLKREVRI